MCNLPLDPLFCDGVIYGHFFFLFLHTRLPANFKNILAIPISFARALFSEDEGVDSWSDSDEDESSIKVVKCWWKGCGAVLQSKARGLRHMQVAHVREVVIGSFAFVRGLVMANYIHSERQP